MNIKAGFVRLAFGVAMCLGLALSIGISRSSADCTIYHGAVCESLCPYGFGQAFNYCNQFGADVVVDQNNPGCNQCGTRGNFTGHCSDLIHNFNFTCIS
jgi:hypothetical protein